VVASLAVQLQAPGLLLSLLTQRRLTQRRPNLPWPSQRRQADLVCRSFCTTKLRTTQH
jgi:hypothetical protein